MYNPVKGPLTHEGTPQPLGSVVFIGGKSKFKCLLISAYVSPGKDLRYGACGPSSDSYPYSPPSFVKSAEVALDDEDLERRLRSEPAPLVQLPSLLSARDRLRRSDPFVVKDLPLEKALHGAAGYGGGPRHV